MRLFTTILFILIGNSWLLAQSNEKQRFKFPQNITPADYESGVVLVKLKKEYEHLFNSQVPSRLSSSGIEYAKPFLPKKLASKAQSRQAPRAQPLSGIDLSLYYEVKITPGEDVEATINRLYATGYFEIVEPSYKYHQFYQPNDQSIASQYYLEKIKAFEAWDVSKASTDVVIAIIDTGGDLNHPDIAPKLFVNENEIPDNGVDDDGNGLIDDVYGWDFSGAQQALIGTPDYVGDNDPSVVKGGGHSHGTMVGGAAAAATDNNIGIAGVGFNARLLFTKHFADDQPLDATTYSSNLYLGMLYAAEIMTANNVPYKIINCSFGGSGRSQIIQDLINFVTLDLGCLVVAAAGNHGTEEIHYPAGYENVISVASTDANDQKAGTSAYGTWIDISAPGVSIYTTSYNDIYSTVSGTSLASPITAGAAALVWTAFPDFTPQQVAEKLRVTADESVYSNNFSTYAKKLGKGRLNVFNALTKNFPSLRASNLRLQNQLGSSAVRPGQSGKLYFDINNILSPTSPNVKVTATSSSPLVTFTSSEVYPGVIGHNGTVSIKQNPFTFTVANNVAINQQVSITITYSDGEYNDFEIVSINLNPSYIHLEENQISTTISSKGRIGYDGTGQTTGLGFQFNGTPLLYEMGIILGNSSTNILNNVRGIIDYDQDFSETGAINQVVPGERSTTEVFGQLSNSTVPASQTILIDYRSLVWREAPNNQFVIMEYKLKNPTASTITNYYMGLFADWDIAAGDGANWNADWDMGYVFPKSEADLPLAGIQVLTGNALGHAIENNQDVAGAPFGLYDGYTDEEKFTSISTFRAEAGLSEEGEDVSHVVSSGPHTIGAGEVITIAFAIHAASNLDDLIASAEAAHILYNQTLQAPTPIVPEVEACYNGSAEITATGASSFKWYKNFTGGEPFFTGNQFVTGLLKNDTVFYVSNADNAYESVRSPAVVTLRAKPIITSSGAPAICEGNSITLTANEADEYEWSTGETTQSITVTGAGTYSVVVKDLELSCESTSDDFVTTILPSPTAAFSATTSSFTNTPIIFTDESIDAVAWLWLFGNGNSSTFQNPVHQYSTRGDYEVTLTVTAANGCKNTLTKSIDIITSIEQSFATAISVYPNPLKSNTLTIELESVSPREGVIEIISSQGKKLYSETIDLFSHNGSLSHQIDVSNLPDGLYLVTVQGDNGEKAIKKIVKSN